MPPAPRPKQYRYIPTYSVLHDRGKSWEEFNMESLHTYFAEGITTLRKHIDKLADLSVPRTGEEDKNLWFMIEALIQARHVFDERKQEVNAAVTPR